MARSVARSSVSSRTRSRRLRWFMQVVTISALAGILLALSPLAFLPAANAQAQGQLEISVPGQVQVGEAIDFTVKARGVVAAGGFEATMLFDTSVAEFHFLDNQGNDLLEKFGRDITPLAAVEVPYGAAIGLVSCPVRSCVNRQGPREDKGGNGNVELTIASIVANQPGVLEVTFASIKLVTAVGKSLPITIPSQTFHIQVGAPGEGPLFTAPARPWDLPVGAADAVRPPDVTGNGRVTHSDLMEVALEWQWLREQGTPCGTLSVPELDVNSDGCIDVADVQLVASRYDPPSESESVLESIEEPASEDSSELAQTGALTFTVNATGDGDDSNIGNGQCRTSSGNCTLRAAIQESKAHAGLDRIHFNIPGAGPHTIQLSKSLPNLNGDNGPVIIDGFTQPGSVPNSAPQVSNAVVKVQIEGSGEGGFPALKVTSSGNTIRGLAWYKLNRALWLYGNTADNNTIVGNFIGTNAAGTYGASGIPATPAHGVHMEKGASGNRIGNANLGDRNVLSGSGRHGVGLWHSGTNGNVIVNNLVGLSPDGSRCLANRIEGVDLNYGASNNTIGGTGANQRNVATGNGLAGIDISHNATTSNNQVVGNYIGTGAGGKGAPANCNNNEVGIRIKDGVRNNVVRDNVIGNNRVAGIDVQSPPTERNNNITTLNTIRNNWIGVAVDGTAIPNQIGIKLNGQNNTIGPDNIIARNTADGIWVNFAVSRFNRIMRNSMYNNGGLGIDLLPNGVNPNDSGDGDNGANQKLNFPVLTSASTASVAGTACSGCTVEIFAADSGAGANGEGRRFVASGVAGSNGSFQISVSGGVSSGEHVTATATDTNGNTSEFSANRLVGGGGGGSSAISLPGRIEAENYGSGGPGVSFNDTTSGNTGGACRTDDVDIQNTTDSGGGCNVGWVVAGEWLSLNVQVATNGNYTFRARVASLSSGKRFRLEVDGANVTGSINVPNTGGWQNWTNVSSGPTSLTAGVHTVRIVFETNGFNLNYVDVVQN